jgi:mono/diheme cytochrome c family protein
MSFMHPLIIASAALMLTAGVAQAQMPDPSLVKQGQYLAALGDCTACHTAPGGADFAGGLPIASPIGTIYSTNITPDKATGIGGWSEADFARLLRKGVTKKGYVVYPAMPFPSYSRLTDDDVKAMYAYFMLGVAPVDQANHANGIHWPLSIRWPMHVWSWVFAPAATPFTPQPGQSAQVARGAYLVEGLGHCGTCHTSRAITLQETALTDQDGPSYLAGGAPVDGWLPLNLRGDNLTGLGAWSESDIVAFLKNGANTNEAAFGGMSDVVHDSMQYASDADLHAIAAYLKTLPPSDAKNAAFVYDDAESKKLLHGDASAPGAIVYLNNCAACHRTDGKGYPGTFPALAGNPVVLSENPISLAHIMLSGAKRPQTQAAPSSLVMPAFAWKLSDQQAADVLTFIRSSWGNNAPAVTPNAIAAQRKSAVPVQAPAPPATGD